MKFKKIITLLLTVSLSVSSVCLTDTNAKVQSATHGVKFLVNVPVKTAPRLQAGLLSDRQKYQSIEKAASKARKDIRNHKSNVSVYVKTTNSDPTSTFASLEEEIFKETANADEGDYMRWDIDREYPRYQCVVEIKGKKTYYYYCFKIEMWYLTTLQQKKQVNQKVKELISSFGFTEHTTDAQKVKKIYDYVCNNVAYAQDVNQDIVYTSWSALFQKEAVCQGYAQLIYRMLKEVGISARLIPGYAQNYGESHGWNIVKLGELYYNVDATWDAVFAQKQRAYQFFLKGDNFSGHDRMKEYDSKSFYTRYPMAQNDYGKGVATASQKSVKAKFTGTKPKFKKVSRGKIKLKKVSFAKTYQVVYGTNSKFNKDKKTKKTKKTTFQLKLKKNKKYYIKFRAYTKVDHKKIYTKWSKTKKINKK